MTEATEEQEDKPADCLSFREAATALGLPERRIRRAADSYRIREFSSTRPWPGRPDLNQLTFEVSLSEARKYFKSIGAIE